MLILHFGRFMFDNLTPCDNHPSLFSASACALFLNVPFSHLQNASTFLSCRDVMRISVLQAFRSVFSTSVLYCTTSPGPPIRSTTRSNW